MSLIYQAYLSFQTPMYTWKSAAASAPAATPVPITTTTAQTTNPEETNVDEDPVIHDLCLHFQRAMVISTIWNTTSMDQEMHGLCHSFRSMTVQEDKNDEVDDADQQQLHDHDDEPGQFVNHLATSATAATTTTTTTSETPIQNDPIMDALCAQMQLLSIHHVLKQIQKKISCVDYHDEHSNNVCPIPAKRQWVY